MNSNLQEEILKWLIVLLLISLHSKRSRHERNEPMAIVGKNDAFERNYMGKFRAFVAEFGEFVSYERDRGARDIGMHLTQKLKSGKERLSSSLVWFQLKGIMESTLSECDARTSDRFSVSLKVDHMKFWYLQPIPTHLVLFVESLDQFYILNLSRYIENRWGKGNIFT